jgi:single-strand DNA-binding protein
MNSVTLIGNLATDVELKELDAERKVASFLLAVDRPVAKEDGTSAADFFKVSTWNKQAELCGQYLARGRQVAIDGKLRSRSWDDADGKRRTAVEVVANHVQFLGTPTREDAA